MNNYEIMYKMSANSWGYNLITFKADSLQEAHDKLYAFIPGIDHIRDTKCIKGEEK